jgi:O-antigen/teichoic acid export membrane protein
MIPQAETTVHNAGLLLVQRGFYFVGCFVFAALVPRMMGPGIFGQYALITSLSVWFMLFGGLGFTQIISRYMPQFTLPEARENLGKFFGNLLTLRLASSALGASLYLLLTFLWLRDLDVLALAIMSGALCIRGVANLFFDLFLGLNQAGRWGMNETMRRWISLILLLPGFYWGGLRGACLALLLSELAVLAVGVYWGRQYLSWSNLGLDFYSTIPYLGFGLMFFASDLINSGFDQSGELLVRTVSGDYDQVSYFGLAHNIYLILTMIIPVFTLAFAPLLVTLLARGETAEIKRWVEQITKVLAITGMIAVFGALLLGKEVVPRVLGAAYQPVAVNLLPLMVTLLAQALSSVGNLLALVFGRSGTALRAAGLKFVAFWVLGLPLVSRWGSLGGCLAVLMSIIFHALYITWRMREVNPYSLKKYAWVIGLGGMFLPLLWLRSSWSLNLALFCAFLVAYGSVLLFLGLISRKEIAAVVRVVSLRGWIWGLEAE